MATKIIPRPRDADEWLERLGKIERLADRLVEHTLQLHRPLKRDLPRLLETVPSDTLRDALLGVALRLACLPLATADLLEVIERAGPRFRSQGKGLE